MDGSYDHIYSNPSLGSGEIIILQKAKLVWIFFSYSNFFFFIVICKTVSK